MGWFLQNAWLIPLLPLIGFAVITLTPIQRNKNASAWLATLLMVGATIIALGTAVEVAGGVKIAADGAVAAHEEEAHATKPAADKGAGHGFAWREPNIVRAVRWAPAGGDAPFTMGYIIDPAVAAMLVMVTITATCIHLFSVGYMAHDPRQARFFSFISLFTAAMLAMVMASNLLLFFMAWEIMGLCSYLLIGFWYDKNYADPNQITPRQAAIKAFITTRIGDVLFMIGLAWLWIEAGTLELGTGPGQVFNPDLLERLATTTTGIGISAATGIALLIFSGTIGKSAQFPLHVWLPDAMEGPTPVSALIHAATMVSAGVFLTARTFPIFQISDALPVVATIGAFTALFAALIAVGQFDIKRILAYSTLSQLGFMIAALGVGGWVAAMFHLLTHAFFKALLFLGSGSVIHGMEATVGHDSNTAQDIRNMGGLRRFMPVTFFAYMAGFLALAGFPGFAGFWSKDEILADAFRANSLVWVVLSLASLLTAFYMTRQIMVVFFGSFRGHHPRQQPYAFVSHIDHHEAHDPHESPWTMTAPLVILALFAVFAGVVNLPFDGFHQLADFFGQEAGKLNLLVMAISSAIALGGILLGWLVYRNAFASSAEEADPLERIMPGVFTLLNRKFYFDELYAATFGIAAAVLARIWTWFDERVIDRVVIETGRFTRFLGQVNFIIDDAMLNDGADLMATGTQVAGDRTRRTTTGKVQDYVALAFAGAVVLGVLYLYLVR
jgi:NADH-quinone oxidoreductase subunit L